MAKKNRKPKKSDGDNTALIATLAAGGIGLLIGLFALGRKVNDGASGVAGAVDRALGLPSGAAADGGSSAADLALNEGHHGPSDRAGEDFRPDMSAEIPADRREAFAPATLPNPNKAQPAM